MTSALHGQCAGFCPRHERGFATAAPGVAHSFTNARIDQSPVRLVNLMTPGLGFDRYLEEVMAAADEPTTERLNEQYGVQMMGPPLAVTLGLSS